jgi:hypothetical protein
MGKYKWFTDTGMLKLGLRPRNSFSGNICFKFSLLCLCSVSTVYAVSCCFYRIVRSCEGRNICRKSEVQTPWNIISNPMKLITFPPEFHTTESEFVSTLSSHQRMLLKIQQPKNLDEMAQNVLARSIRQIFLLLFCVLMYIYMCFCAKFAKLLIGIEIQLSLVPFLSIFLPWALSTHWCQQHR